MCIVAISEIPIIVERKKERNKKWRTIAYSYGQRGKRNGVSRQRSVRVSWQRHAAARTAVLMALSTTHAVSLIYLTTHFSEQLLHKF